MPLLIFEGTRFSHGVDLLFCGSRARGRFSLLDVRFVAYKSNMLLRLLWGNIKFMVAYLLPSPNLYSGEKCVRNDYYDLPNL
jgi:hypothetical protein